ncbi:MAG: MHS family MFS transporter [Leptospiraceae bacterium]|nr:MHS family MFS transporter [Leptospiraceae bacterium]
MKNVKTISNRLENSNKIWKVIFASSVGTMIEWYDFYIFGTLATFIAVQFYPKGNETVSYLATLATFATGFIVRPFGAIIFGHIGDKLGRKYTFLITMLIMGGATFVIGILPSYEVIGIWAPIALVILRLVQGLALGGEYGGAATYIAEHSPDDKRGFYTSFIQTTATLGLFISIGVILLTRSSLSANEFSEWGWRIPFLLSAFLVLISYYIRIRLEESPVFAEMKAAGKTSRNPIKDSFGNAANLKLVLISLFGATAGQGVVWYTGQFYALSFLEKILKVDYTTAYTVVAIAIALATPFFIFFGSLSDKIGRKKIILTGCLLAAILYIPLYSAMVRFQNNTVMLTIFVFVQVIFVTMVYGPIAAFLVEIFPTRIRYTSMSLPYHIGNGVFGGLTPFIASSLVAATGNIYSGLYYPITVAILTFIIGVFLLPESHKLSIEQD